MHPDTHYQNCIANVDDNDMLMILLKLLFRSLFLFDIFEF